MAKHTASPRCPGKDHFLASARALDKNAVERLVAHRARRVLGPGAKPPQRKRAASLEKRVLEHLEKIHLGADFLPASFLRDGAARATAVCRIRTPTAEGTFLATGFLIAPGVIMTNNHVLEKRSNARSSFVEFGFEEELSPTIRTLDPARLFITDASLDFTVVALDGDAPANTEPIRLRQDPAAAIVGERVSIIQHPSGRAKEVALHDNRVEDVRDTVVQYRTDTEPGSSGSPVFNSDWELVALHHAGVKEADGTALNEGIRVCAIVDRLLDRAASGGSEVFRALTDSFDQGAGVGFFDQPAAVRAREVEIPDFRGDAAFADIGVWNVENFNRTIDDDRLEDVTEVIARLSLDVLGLVEVEEPAMERLVEALAARGIAADFVLLDVNHRQDLAVLFDPDTTQVTRRDDLSARFAERISARTAGGKTAFPRAPIFADCTVSHPGGTSVRFLMITVHLKAFGDTVSRERRRLAAEKLREIVADLRRSEGLPVVIGGDFNETLSNDVLSPLTGSPDLLTLTADDEDDGAISFVGASHRSLIDHLVVSHDVVLGDIVGDDAAIVRLDQSVADFSDRVSDHVPLVMRMAFRDQGAVFDPDADNIGIGAHNGDAQHTIRVQIPVDADAVCLELERVS